MTPYNRKNLGLIIKHRRTELGLTQQQVATMISMSRAAYIHIENGTSSAPLDRIISLNTIFGMNLIANDLIMRKEDGVSYEEYKKVYENSAIYSLGEQLEKIAVGSDKKDRFIKLPDGKLLMAIDLIEQSQYDTFFRNFNDEAYRSLLPKHWLLVDKEHQGEYISMIVKGPGMVDGTVNSIPDYSRVVGRNIKKDYWKNGLFLSQWKYYILIHKSGILIKEIIKHDIDKSILVLRSLNPDKEYFPDMEVKISDCLAIYNIVDKTLPV